MKTDFWILFTSTVQTVDFIYHRCKLFKNELNITKLSCH